MYSILRPGVNTSKAKEMHHVCRGPAPADPGYSKRGWHRDLFIYLFIKDKKNNRMRIAQ